MPANAGIYFNCLMQIAAFDFWETEEFYSEVLDGYETEPYTKNFGIIGFESMWFLNNMGLMGIVLLLVPLIFLIRPLLARCGDNVFVDRFRVFLKKNLFWSFFIRLMTEGYIIITLCIAINFNRLKWNHPWDSFNSSLTIIVATGMLLLPIRLIYSLHKHKDKLANKYFKQRLGSAYEEMRTNIEGNGLIKVVGYYFLRRLLLAMTVVLLEEVLVIQFFNFVMSSIF